VQFRERDALEHTELLMPKILEQLRQESLDLTA
jgi:hypothetical protein